MYDIMYHNLSFLEFFTFSNFFTWLCFTSSHLHIINRIKFMRIWRAVWGELGILARRNHQKKSLIITSSPSTYLCSTSLLSCPTQKHSRRGYCAKVQVSYEMHRETFNKKAIFGPPACWPWRVRLMEGCSRKGEKVRAEVKLEREKVQTLR